MRNIFGFILLTTIIVSCTPSEQSSEKLIQNVIEYHGGEAYDSLNLQFKFRDKLYVLKHEDGKYQYERIFQDSTGREIDDVLDNSGFKRLIEGEKAELTSKDSTAYANSVNSVHYFALLPYNLQDEAVLAHNVDDALINGKPYKTVEVKFEQEGGGTDHEDVFMFWFNSNTYEMDFFAYSYQTEGGGVRFRESINKVKVDGVIFQDYNNFKAELGTELSNLPSMFENKELELLSKIELEFDVQDL
jgi:hypothetical protein